MKESVQVGERKRKWQSLFEEGTKEMKGWRRDYWKATFNDIESTVDEKLARI